MIERINSQINKQMNEQMNTQMNNSYDVIIGGAGPVGLFLACELGLAGASVLVLERDEDLSSPWKTKPLGIRGLNTLSSEAFYRRGLKDQIFDPDFHRHIDREAPTFKFAGHFAGILLDANKFDLSRYKYRLAGPSLIPGATYVERMETALAKRAESFGAKIFRGTAITAFSQDINSVSVCAGEHVYRAKYLVGCDGGRSTIRKEAGFEFVGTQAEFTGYNVICELEEPEKLKQGWQVTPMGMYVTRELGHIIVMDFADTKVDRSQSLTPEQFQNVLRRVSGTDVTIKHLEQALTFTDRALQATTYRKERIFLAGDSAHIHSPLGAQGLNAGIGDANNLGWKLAAVVKGIAPDALLDTYTAERHPIAAAVLEWSRAQVATLKPDLFGAASAKIVRDLIKTTDGTNYFIDRIWGLSMRYDLGDEHPLVGSSAPDFEFADGSRLGSKMECGKGLLLDFTDNSQLAELVAGWESQVDYVNAKVAQTLDLSALLIRPDGIVAWVSESQADLDKAKVSLVRWFGDGSHRHSRFGLAACSSLPG